MRQVNLSILSLSEVRWKGDGYKRRCTNSTHKSNRTILMEKNGVKNIQIFKKRIIAVTLNVDKIEWVTIIEV